MVRSILCGLLLIGLLAGCSDDATTNTLPPEPGLEKAPVANRPKSKKEPMLQPMGDMPVSK